MKIIAAGLMLAIGATAAGAAEPSPDYPGIVRKFADTMLDKGRDNYGPKKTALWCGVINVEDYSVPQHAKDVPEPPGVRASDRSVGGTNLYQDVSSLRTFQALSKVTGDPRYEQAARDYVRDYLAAARDPVTGLLAWGEHLYYNVHRDKVSGRAFHELLEWTPPLDLLWDVNPQATTREIEGLKYHFLAEDPASKGWIFNRHADWGKAQYQTPEVSQPWIKHSALYAYYYSFLFSKTRDRQWRERALGIGELYWNHRNPATNLTVGCIGDARPWTQDANMGSISHLSYWLLKTASLDPTNTAARDHALTMLKAFARYAWDAETKSYYQSVKTDGTPIKQRAVDPWKFAYGGGSSLITFGRVTAFAARTENDADLREAAIRAVNIVNAAPLPEVFTPQEIGFGIHLNLDVYGLTGDKAYLAQADRLGKIAVEKLWANGLFRRTPGDKFYEAKVGPGDLASALLRLSLRLEGKPDPAGIYDWSF